MEDIKNQLLATLPNYDSCVICCSQLPSSDTFCKLTACCHPLCDSCYDEYQFHPMDANTVCSNCGQVLQVTPEIKNSDWSKPLKTASDIDELCEVIVEDLARLNLEWEQTENHYREESEKIKEAFNIIRSLIDKREEEITKRPFQDKKQILIQQAQQTLTRIWHNAYLLKQTTKEEIKIDNAYKYYMAQYGNIPSTLYKPLYSLEVSNNLNIYVRSMIRWEVSKHKV